MKRSSTTLLILALLVVAMLSGYNYFKRPFLSRFAQPEVAEEMVQQPSRAQLVLDTLSPRQKVLQLIAFPVMVDGMESSVAAELAWIRDNQPGLVTMFGSNLTTTEVVDFIAVATPSAQEFSPLIAVDHEGGMVQRLRGSGFTTLPSWRQICAMDSTARAELLTDSAAELALAGVQIVFAPVLDVAQAGSFLGTRACTDPDQVVVAATDYITSFGRFGILPVVKHFPGIGSATRDLHFASDTVELTAADTKPFNDILTAFPNIGAMTTHAVVAERTDGVPCSLSSVCLDVFPKHFPQVLLFADALEMESALVEEGTTAQKTLAEVAAQAVEAGNHVLVFGEPVSVTAIDEVVEALVARFAADPAFAQKIDAAALKILTLKLPESTGGAL